MQNLKSYLCSSVGRKQIVAVTGIVWSGFVLTHMAGNCLLFVGPDAYNKYSHALVTNPAIYGAEAFLVLCLLIHMGMAIRITLENRVARSKPPFQNPSNCEKGASFASKTMILTGLLIFFFIVWHLLTFKFGPEYTTQVGGVEMRDIYRLVLEVFANPLYVFPYAAFLIVLGLHLSHGVGALVQTLGLSSVRCACVQKFARGFALLIVLGFLSQPLYFYFRGGN